MELKKTRKKALALVLAACVTGTSSTPVFAAEDLFTDTPVVETPDFGTEAASSVKKDVTIIYTCNGEEIKRDRVTINDDKKSITVDYINSLPSKYGLGLPDGYVFIEKEEFDINGNECYVEVRKKIQETGYLQFSGEGMEAVQTEVKLGTTVPLMDFLGKVPEGKVFAGWTLNGKKVYAAGESFTFDKALAQDMGTSADGVQGYLFSFKANFEDAKATETGYLQFEGMDNFVEVELGSTLPLMNYHGEVPEGKVFAGWTLNGKKVYAAGENFTFDKALAQDMGTSADGVQGYLFSFKASFEDAKVNEAGYIQFSGEGMETVQTEVKLGTTVPLMNFLGKVPEGKVFAGWTLDGKKVYAAGENFTFDKALAQDMGTNADGVQGYLFSFKASFEDAKVNEAGYIQFSGEGMETVQTEVKLGTTVPLMNFLGKVPEGKVFAGWTLDGKKVYAAGENFTFDKALAQDMGTNADGVQGYLFSFKASFEDAKVNEAGYIQFSGEGMETVQTEVKLGTTVPLMNFLGKVPEGKVFAGWTLDGKKVYAAGENFTFDKALAQDMGTNADGVQGYLFSFKAAFDASEKKINVVFKTKTGNVISNKAMMVPYTEKYVDASNLTAPKGYKLVSEGNLRIVGDNVTAIVTKISSSVSRKKISTLSFRGVAAAYEQTGKQIRPRVTIKDGRKVLKLNKDYTITYKNNIKRGRASIIIKGKNNYYGTKTITFRIVSKGLR